MTTRADALWIASALVDPDQTRWHAIREHVEALPDGDGLSDRISSVFTIAAIAQWARNGLQSIVMPHRLAAALIATDLPGEIGFKLPWPAFEIRVPNNLLTASRGDLRSILVAENVGNADLVIDQFFDDSEAQTVVTDRSKLGADYDVDWFEEANGLEHDARDKRVALMATRLLVNTCLMMTAHRESESVDFTARVRRAKDTTHVTEFVPGRALRVDCVQDVRDYVAGKRSVTPKVTTLVRGHWRNQVHGAARALRKLIWIQPFYRGEGAMVVRPTLLGVRGEVSP